MATTVKVRPRSPVGFSKSAARPVVVCVPKGLVTRYCVAKPPVNGSLHETENRPSPSLTAERFCTGPGGRATTVVVATVGATVVGGAVGATVVGATVVVGARVVVGSTVVVGAIVVVVTVVVVTGGGDVGGTVVVGASVVVGATVVVVAVVVVVTGGVVPSVRENERKGPAPIGPMASTVKVKGIPRFSPIAETASDVDAVVMLSPKLVVIL
jgi:hypothetical protein